MNKKSLGFTLIELLVVISIISLLSSVILASVKDARDKAEKAALRQYMGQLVNALELYRSDNNKYPTSDQENIKDLVDYDLNPYISYQNISKLIFASGYTAPSGASRYSCSSSQPNNGEYMISLTSKRSDLNLPKLYYNGTTIDNGPNYFYCASLAVR